MEEIYESEEKIFLKEIYPKILEKVQKNEVQNIEITNYLPPDLSQELWKELIKNKSLKSLTFQTDLHEFNPKYLDEFLESHAKLVYFSLNCKENIKFTFFKTLLNLSHLQTLKLEYIDLNNFDFINLNNFLLKSMVIEELILDFNHIGQDIIYLCEGIEKSSSLKILSIKKNQIKSSEIFIDALIENNSITELNLSYNPIVGPFFPNLKRMKKLKSLFLVKIFSENFEENSFNDYIFDLFNGINIQNVNLFNCQIDDEIAEKILEKLMDSDLRSLDLRNNPIGSKSMKVISQLLKTKKNLKSLKFLGDIDEISVNLLSQGVQESQSIEEISFDCSNHLDLFNIEKNQSLKTLKLFDNEIQESKFIKFMDNLSSNHSITFLDIPYIKITLEGAEYLAKYLKKNQSLTFLSIEGCNIDDFGLEHLCDALESNFTLKELKMNNNSLTNEGMKHLKKLYQNNKTITSLDLGCNVIEDSGIQYLVEYFHNIENIYLDSNAFSNEGLKFIKSNIFYNLNMKKCHLEDEEFNEDDENLFYDIRFILLRNMSFIQIEYKFNHLKDILFNFSINSRSEEFEGNKNNKKRKIEYQPK